MRTDRKNDELRSLKITTGFSEFAAGSALIETGKTKVLCTASVEERVPPFLYNSDKGWVTAEYSMLPGATPERSQRDISRLKLSPRSAEIQRLIGRALRSVTDLRGLCGLTITVDCDVLQADGGTRTAAVTGGYLALWLACDKLLKAGTIAKMPFTAQVAAVSAGIVKGVPLLDLDYEEDSGGEADFNMVMTDRGEIVELQGTGEERPFSRAELDALLALGEKGVRQLCAAQREHMR